MSEARAPKEDGRSAPDPVPRPVDHLLQFGTADDTALIGQRLPVTYAQAERRTGELAAMLALKGFAPGARVATWLPKTIDACLMPLAAPRAGLVHIPVNPVLKRAQVAHILADGGASLLLTSASRATTLTAEDRGQCPVWASEEAEGIAGNDVMPPSSASPQELAAILYTSGSTGRPKGVMLSHANLWLGAVSVAHYLGIERTDRVLAILPLGFDYGQNQLFSTWYGGGAVVPIDYLMQRDVIRVVERHGITTIAAVPPLWHQLCEVPWGDAARSVRRLTNSGGALTGGLIARMQGIFPGADLYPMYGLTEAFRSTYLDPTLVAAHPTSMGRAIPFAEVMVVNEGGREGKEGELVHAGPLVAQGYWRDAERTAARFRPAPIWSKSGGTAVWSGDKVWRDDRGLLYFVGREDEMIKTLGHRVSPFEIEEAAIASGAVDEAVAFGVDDERAGQAIMLIARGNGDEDRLRAYLKSELPGHMQPREIVWKAELPRNANGKIDRAAVQK